MTICMSISILGDTPGWVALNTRGNCTSAAARVAPGRECAAAIRPMAKNKGKKYFICRSIGSEKIKAMQTNKPTIKIQKFKLRNIWRYWGWRFLSINRNTKGNKTIMPSRSPMKKR